MYNLLRTLTPKAHHIQLNCLKHPALVSKYHLVQSMAKMNSVPFQVGLRQLYLWGGHPLFYLASKGHMRIACCFACKQSY